MVEMHPSSSISTTYGTKSPHEKPLVLPSLGPSFRPALKLPPRGASLRPCLSPIGFKKISRASARDGFGYRVLVKPNQGGNIAC